MIKTLSFSFSISVLVACYFSNTFFILITITKKELYMDRTKYYRQTPNYVSKKNTTKYKQLIINALRFFSEKKNAVIHKGKWLLIVLYSPSVERFVT